MISEESTLEEKTNEEIPALIETLLATEQRLEDLTEGQIDTVAGRDGRTVVLRRAQDQLRHNEAVKQSAILNALPAHIALLDGQGFIISVNEAWRCFADANALDSPGHGVGLNYLAICDQAQGLYSDESHQIAAGIRGVLDRREHSFSIEYSCDSPAEPRWFLMTVSPLAQDHPNGAVVMHLNITERKLAASALEELSQKTDKRERMLTTLLANLHDFAYIYDRNGCFLFANQTLLDLWGLTLDSVVGKNFYELGYPDDLAKRLQQELQDVFKTGTSVTGETPYVSPAGVTGFYEYIFSPAFGEDGTVEFVVGSTRDITQRKRAEQSLKQSEAWLDAIFEASRDGIVVEENDLVIYANKALANLYGYGSQEEMIAKHVSAFRTPDENQRLLDFARKRIAGEDAPTIYEFKGLKKDSSLFDAEVSVSSFQSDGRPFIVSTLRDITKRKQAETDLRESDEKFRELSATITDVFWIVSPDFKTMHYVSAGYELIWGRSTESLFADPHQWIEAILPEERERAFAVFGTLMGTASDVTVEYRIARPDGTVRWIHDRGFQVRDAAGKLVRITGIASDITERKKMEAQLRQSQKMEAIGTLAGGIAHDFNNILAAIMGYTELAQKGLSPNGRPHAQLAQVLKASGRARDLVQQILTFSRRDEQEQQGLCLQDIIEETLDLIKASMPASIEIRQTIDHAVPRILGDATQIQQLIMNLCLNAGHAMKQGNGILGISLTSSDIGADFREAHPELGQGPHVLLAISDTGCGIDRTAQTRIFDPFYTTKAPGEGTGLGLAVVHGVVKNHNGVVTVQSEVGVGTTFSIYLPVCECPAGAVVQDAVTIPRGNGEHILFVDDEEALASLGKLMLEDIGYRVTAKTDSVESLAVFRSQSDEFDLVVSDQTMPHLNGADFAKALLEIRPALPVILLTGYSSTITPEIAKAIGIEELLLKPCPMHVLGEAIQRALGVGKKTYDCQYPVD